MCDEIGNRGCGAWKIELKRSHHWISSPSPSHSDLSHKEDLRYNTLKCFLHRVFHNRLHLVLYAISGLDYRLVV